MKEKLAFYYYGILPKKKSVYISLSKKADILTESQVYTSVVEASLNGYDVIITNPFSSLWKAVEKAIIDSNGRLHIIIFNKEQRICKRFSSLPVLTNGSFIELEKKAEESDFESFSKTKYLAVSFASFLIIANNENYYAYPNFDILYALDKTVELGVLSSALNVMENRNIVRDGAKVINSFSDIYPLSEFRLYPDCVGKYQYMDFKYGVLEYSKYEKVRKLKK